MAIDWGSPAFQCLYSGSPQDKVVSAVGAAQLEVNIVKTNLVKGALTAGQYLSQGIQNSGDAVEKFADAAAGTAGTAEGSMIGAGLGSFLATTAGPVLVLGLGYMIAKKQRWL